MNKRKETLIMNNIIRAWKDEAYRQGLSVEEQAMLPANPAGEVELTDMELEAVHGACNHHSDDPSKVKLDVDQKAIASFSGGVTLVNSMVTCTATATSTASVDHDSSGESGSGNEQGSWKCWWA
jgi:mersacidin/lichenicidin family type 2 lantibiotic